MENKLLAVLFASREYLPQLEKFQVKESLSDLGQVLYQYALDFYQADPNATKVDIELINTWIERDFPRQKDLLHKIIQLFPSEVSAPNLVKEVVNVKQEALARELSSRLLAPGRQGVEDLIERYLTVNETIQDLDGDNDVITGASVEDIFTRISEANRIRLWPSGLNELCAGGALRGNNILVFGRPEVGKSAFLINLVGGLLHDGHRVLFCENEDPTDATLSRLVCRLSGMTVDEVRANPKKAQKLCDKRGYENFIFKSMSPGTFYEIQNLVDRFEPIDVVIINQLRNIHVGREDRVNQLERAASLARSLAKSRDLVVINTTQAGDSATDKAVLEMGDVDFSNTGIPAQMDLMIGIGCTPELEQRGHRMISLPKNKLSGDHAFFSVAFDPKLSKITS